MRSLDVDYVLIILRVIGYSGDDINKFLWMVRIAEGEHPKDICKKLGRSWCVKDRSQSVSNPLPFLTALYFLSSSCLQSSPSPLLFTKDSMSIFPGLKLLKLGTPILL